MEIVRSVWPDPLDDVTDDDLDRIYGYPDDLDRPWVQANFTSSADGASTLEGRSEGLSGPADKRIFFHGRLLADVVLAGAGTVRAENYRGARTTPERRERRARLGLAEVPPIAVVTGSARLDPSAPLFTDTKVPPIVITTEHAPAERRAALAEAGADILLAGEETIDLRRALDGLAERGLLRVNCEGGPHLFGELVAEDLVDQLCVTVAPLLAGGGADRIAIGRMASEAREMDLASILVEDGFTMLRYRRRG
ncbi:pyrimidine reductase family protein [Amycolatopsis thermophila]|uniref:Riboflavin-specific deaminase-like protein n=1 Tax=Amycolatopsis thermophila TaxID=206084 RepID=A0ABU0EZH8_9PSEU|nr:pyrimidine reductase family protein [Amycolatopsis thermophila]MDQ0380260.1 riboflavin-specific deaminase-like protein [Amycolatopsis thermophila]